MKRNVIIAIIEVSFILLLFIEGSDMLFTTGEVIPYKEIDEILGVVSGNVVQTKNVARDIFAGLKSIVGGELTGYTELMSEARQKAIVRMVDEAKEKQADAIINIRFSTSQIMDGAAEILVYGTAIKLKK